MKKWNMMLLALTMMLLPAMGSAQELPDFLSAVYAGVGEGLEQGAMQAIAAMNQELTLEVTPSSERIEEGQTIRLTVTAGNPRPQTEDVTFVLNLPSRLTAAPDLAWEAVLPQAEMDPQTGMLMPSVTTFTREITLEPGGGSEQADITAEMSMGTRFYRAGTQLALCVPDVSAKAAANGALDGRVQPGDVLTYQVEIENNGTAPKDVRLQLALPRGTEPAQPLPMGFELEENVICGHVRAEAANPDASTVALSFPVRIAEDVLEGDEDAMRLLSGALLVDGERVALPRVEVCGAKIRASLLPEKESLEAGERTTLSVMVVNTGLAAADVEVSCVLPQGLKLCTDAEATPGEAVVQNPEDGGAQEAVAVQAGDGFENQTLVFDLHMEAARETANGVIANTRVMEIPVEAGVPQDKLSEVLMGATLAWRVDDRPAQLGEAVAMRVYREQFLGISKEEWNGVFWAGVLLLAAVACLYTAARRDRKEEDFCYE